MVVINACTDEHINAIKGRLRASDIAEVKASHGFSENQAIEYSFIASSMAWALVHNEKPVIIFGVAPTAIEGVGAPWALGTDDVNLVKKELLSYSKLYIGLMLEAYEFLVNWVHAENKASIRWLKWCGFRLEDAKPFGRNGEMFHEFWIDRRGFLCAQ